MTQRPLPRPCPECGDFATVERAGVVICCVCSAGPRQEAQANEALRKLNKKLGVKSRRRHFWARSRKTPAPRIRR